MIYLTFRTSEGCDYDDKEEELSFRDFVQRSNKNLGDLVNLLVENGVVSAEDAYETFKKSGDFNLVNIE